MPRQAGVKGIRVFLEVLAYRRRAAKIAPSGLDSG
jgi:hypothetical protein